VRLSVLDNGHRARARLFLSATSLMSRVDSPDIVRMLLYRPDFLTRSLLDLTAPAMRGESYWTAGEREFLAMSTALRHRCPFCVDSHAELTRIAGAGEIDPDDPASARPQVRAVREFLDGPPDPGPARAAGVPDGALLAALRVRLVWDVVNRLANAFGFVLRPGQLHSGTRALHRFGYRFPAFLLAGGATAPDRDPVEAMRWSVFDGPGRTGPALRRAAVTGEGLDEPLRGYAATVRDASYRIGDGDVERLRAAGLTEDDIFEVTVAATVGAALAAHDEARAVVEGRP
jgi:AhpD family alkylhydroperoxidase